jgi:hypothetical protein
MGWEHPSHSQYSSWNAVQVETPKMIFGDAKPTNSKLKINDTCTYFYEHSPSAVFQESYAF